MGEHKGWLVRDHRPGKVQAKAWDPKKQRHASKIFDDNERDAARMWAQDTHAKFRLAIAGTGDAKRTSDLVAIYIKDLRRRNRRPDHIEDVERTLQRFARQCPRLDSPRIREQAKDWFDGLRRPDGKPYASATRNRYLLHVRALMRYALDEDLIHKDPLRKFAVLAPQRSQKAQFTLSELETIARAVHHRLHSYVAFMLWAGMRRSEPASLTWDRVDFRARIIRVRGKGDKDRIVPLQDELSAVLQPLQGEPSAPIFPRLYGGAAPAVSRQFTEMLSDLGLPRDGRTCHSLRHCYAGLMTATGLPSMMLADAMGHETMTTTRGYATYAKWYAAEAASWAPGQFQLITGWGCALGEESAALPEQSNKAGTAVSDDDELLGAKEIRALASVRMDRVRAALNDERMSIAAIGARRAKFVRRADVMAWIEAGCP